MCFKLYRHSRAGGYVLCGGSRGRNRRSRVERTLQQDAPNSVSKSWANDNFIAAEFDWDFREKALCDLELARSPSKFEIRRQPPTGGRASRYVGGTPSKGSRISNSAVF